MCIYIFVTKCVKVHFVQHIYLHEHFLFFETVSKCKKRGSFLFVPKKSPSEPKKLEGGRQSCCIFLKIIAFTQSCIVVVDKNHSLFITYHVYFTSLNELFWKRQRSRLQWAWWLLCFTVVIIAYHDILWRVTIIINKNQGVFESFYKAEHVSFDHRKAKWECCHLSPNHIVWWRALNWVSEN